MNIKIAEKPWFVKSARLTDENGKFIGYFEDGELAKEIVYLHNKAEKDRKKIRVSKWKQLEIFN